jgi:hypothetical protein
MSTERTPQDFAIEHAEYMAKAAEGLLEAINAEYTVRQRIAESDDAGEHEEYDAACDVSEAMSTMRNRIYEFRKRRDRAIADRARTAASCAVPNGFALAPDYRGYANLGTGQYLLNHSADAPAELIISIATEADKVGRSVGDEHENAPDTVIPVEALAVRIRFSTVAGLDGLEKHLHYVRAVHFPGTPATALLADVAEGCTPADARVLREANHALAIEVQQLRGALKEIALAGMSGSGQESEEGMSVWHARRAWQFIGIAARALDAARTTQQGDER